MSLTNSSVIQKGSLKNHNLSTMRTTKHSGQGIIRKARHKCRHVAQARVAASTCQSVNKLRRLHVEQVGRSVPGGRHRLLPPNQPVSGYDHSLVALKRRQRHSDGRTVTGHVRVHVRLVFIRALHFVFATDLLLTVRAEKNSLRIWSFLARLHNHTAVLRLSGLGPHRDQARHTPGV